MVVTIDGPAGTGKSTAARHLAARLGFHFLDTGAMYRVVAWSCLNRGADPADGASAAQVAASTRIEFDGERTLADGGDVTAAIRTAEVTHAASVVAQIPEVRAELVRQQRRIAEGRDIVCEGRDQGTVAFPRAEHKFFLTAEPLERARRRQQELAEKGQCVALETLLAEQTDRDARDASRAVAPLKPADDAVIVDTTHLDGEAVVDLLVRHVRGTSA
jgi:cytidylate kinase